VLANQHTPASVEFTVYSISATSISDFFVVVIGHILLPSDLCTGAKIYFQKKVSASVIPKCAVSNTSL
jgi:hypothetical protein